MDENNGVELLDNEKLEPLPVPKPSIYSPLVRWLLKKGIAKTEREANMLLLGFIVLLFGLTFFFIYIGNEYGPTTDFVFRGVSSS
jgi:hypothetical protein